MTCKPTLETVELSTKSNLPADSLENSVFYSKFETFLADFNSVVVAPASSNSINTVDRTQLGVNTRALNVFVKTSYDTIGKEQFQILYSNLYERIETGTVITQIETLEFINEYLYNFATFPVLLNSIGSITILTSLNAFYAPENISRNSMGSFCDLVQSIFGGVSGLFEQYKDIADFANKLPSLINSIQNFSAASLIKTLEEKLLSTTDILAKNSLDKLKNFDLGFLGGEQGTPNQTPILQKIDTTKGNIASFFSEFNIDKIKERLKGLVAYVVSLFEKPDIEEIQFIIYRFCKLISEVENLFGGVFSPLYGIRDSYQETQSVLRGRSAYNSMFATSAGALRLTDDQRIAGYNEGTQIVASNVPLDAAAYVPTGAEVGDIPSWEDIRMQNDRDGRIVLDANESAPVYIPRGANRAMSNLSWDKVTVEAKVTLLRFHKNLSAALGRNIKFLINSAYRSPEYNAGLDGAASKSLHMSGIAFDISTTGSVGISSADRITFMNVARQSGFRGIGKYPTFIHVDLGNERSWGSF